MRKIIDYCADGKAFGDAASDKEALGFLSGPNELIRVSTENFILAVRVLVCEGKYPHTDVRFTFEGDVLQPDADGRLPRWPIGFCDHSEIALSKLLRLRIR